LHFVFWNWNEIWECFNKVSSKKLPILSEKLNFWFIL
jgi:hypothetical protein